MATKKKMLQAAAGNAGGGAALNVEDVFSTYLYEGNGGSQTIQNGINLGQSFGSGSGDFDGTSGMIATTTPSLFTSDFTIEAFVYLDALTSSFQDIFTFASPASALLINTSNQLEFYSTTATATSTFPAGQWVHVAVSRSGSTLKLFQDGAEVASISNSTNYTTTSGIYIGSWTDGASEPWAGNISNLRVSNIARYTSAFTAPTSSLSNDSNTTLYLFNEDKSYDDLSSSGLTFTNTSGVETVDFGPFDAAEAGEGGLVWLKNRPTGNTYHALFDTARGTEEYLMTNVTNASTTFANNGVTSFNSDGFTIAGTSDWWNNSGEDIASWTFRKAPKFFDVQTFTSASSGNTTFNHDLGSTPACVIIKNTQTSDPWIIYHVGTGNDKFLAFDTGAAGTLSGSFSVDSTSVTVSSSLMYTSQSYVAYLFAHNDGDGDFGPDGDADIIKCGSMTYTSGTPLAVDLGFEPQWVLVKRTDGADNWFLTDVMRGASVDEGTWLQPSTSNAEGSSSGLGIAAPTATGFIFDQGSTALFASGTYIYIAIRRGTKVPESGTEVFAVSDRKNEIPSFPSGFPVDFLIGPRNLSGDNNEVKTRLISSGYLRTNTNGAETSSSQVANFAHNDGFFNFDGANANQYSWMWKRAPNYMDCVAYTGNGTAGRTVSHNLGVAPEMMWVKRRDNTDIWVVYNETVGNTGFLRLNDTNAVTTATAAWNDTSPTATDFTLGTYAAVNTSSSTYIAYLFASLPGISKVGSFTATGSVLDIDCGFTSGARFVLIKRTDSTGDWFVFDSVRGITASTSPYLYLNSTSSESVANYIDPLSSGFRVTTNFYGSGDFIFYAIA